MEIIWKENNKSLQIFKAIEKTNTIININLNPDGLMIMGMDSSKTCLVQLVLPKSYFDKFDCPAPMEIGVYTASLVSILSKAKNNKLIWKASSDTSLSICLKENAATQTEFSLRCIDVCEDRLNIPKHQQHDVEIDIYPSKLIDILDKMTMAKSDVNIKADPLKVFMVSDSIELGKIRHSEATTNNKNLQCNVKQSVSLLFSYNAMLLILTLCKVSKHICFLGLSNTMPLRLKSNLGDGGFIELYIAPKMQDDD
jgi:proliferating cell nuclear antigen PCNA